MRTVKTIGILNYSQFYNKIYRIDKINVMNVTNIKILLMGEYNIGRSL